MPTTRHVLVLAVDGCQSLDVLGPVEVFDQAARRVPGAYRVDLVAPTRGDTVTMSNGMRLGVAPLPEPPAHHGTLVVAGGEGARAAVHDAAVVDWVARASRHAQRTVSVCTGAYLLAAAGLLDGRRATTHWQFCEQLATTFPQGAGRPGPDLRPRRRRVDLGRRDGRHGPRVGAGRGGPRARGLAGGRAPARDLPQAARRPVAVQHRAVSPAGRTPCAA